MTSLTEANLPAAKKPCATCSPNKMQEVRPSMPLQQAPSAVVTNWSWRMLRRKHVIGILCIIMLLFYMNSTLVWNDITEPIPVIHYSHVPGMKVNITNMVTTTANAYYSNVNANATTESSAIKNITIARTTNKSSFNYTHSTSTINTTINTTIPSGYLVWSDNCKIPNLDPYLPEVMKFFKREKYTPCVNNKPLTSIEFNESEQTYLLRLDEKTLPFYSNSNKVTCCYQAIERNSTGVHADKDVTLSECIMFKKKVNLPVHIDNILVRCREKNKEIYINGYALMPARATITKRLKQWEAVNTTRPPSVLMIGIDSISRIHLIRAMPKTAQYLYDNEWFELSGYNKIDDNTFPNLMAVLTGRNKISAEENCTPTKLHGLDNCNFIWRQYQDHGYVTAYGEDESSINTFNYMKVGFEKPPVDFYLRPFILSAEKHFNKKRKSNLLYCLGYQHSAEYVYNYAIELAQRFQNVPYFGLFWTNTFSHNAISDCSSMDERMVEYMKQFAALGTLNNTIVVFFSDHGMRFGPTRKSASGHYEERLPFIFIWLPNYIKQQHPEFVSGLTINKNRLTNPFDLHMTLKHILTLSKSNTENKTSDIMQPAISCSQCQSLLEPVPHNRSCQETEIPDHWCTCIHYQSVYKDSKLMHKLSHETINYINNYTSTFLNGSFEHLCAPLSLQQIEHAYHAQYFSATLNNCSDCSDIYRIVFYTKPNRALFEATVLYNAHSKAFAVSGEISRLNSYSTDSQCVQDGGAKKYCSCYKRHANG